MGFCECDQKNEKTSKSGPVNNLNMSEEDQCPGIIARAVAAAPQTPQLGGPTLPKGAPNCLEGPEVASIQKQSFAWRIALNGIFCAQILYISVLKFFAVVYVQIAS